MKERLEKLIEHMDNQREVILNEYLASLDKYDGTSSSGMASVNSAGMLHDLDRHITNLHLELKRLEAVNA